VMKMDIWKTKSQESWRAMSGGNCKVYKISTGLLHNTEVLQGVDAERYPRGWDRAAISYTKRRSRDSIKLSNDCVHLITNVNCIPITGRYYSPTYYTDMYNWFIDRDPYNVAKDAINPALDLYDEDFNSRAFAAMKPDLETSLSLSNFLVELTDVKHLLRFFTKWKGFTNKVAEGHLSYKFGIKPFVGDVKTLWSVLTDHQTILDEFLARRGTLQTRHYSETVPLTETYTSWTNFLGVSYIKYRYKHTHEARTTATMVYKFDCPYVDDYSHKLKALRDMLGLRLTASVIWEAIPFSFVVDWFWRVQDFLERFEEPLISSKVTVYDYCISHKSVQTSEREWKWYAAPGGSIQETATDVVTSTSSYRRQAVAPDSGNTFIDRGQYGRNQLALSASLLKVLTGGRR